MNSAKSSRHRVGYKADVWHRQDHWGYIIVTTSKGMISLSAVRFKDGDLTYFLDARCHLVHGRSNHRKTNWDNNQDTFLDYATLLTGGSRTNSRHSDHNLGLAKSWWSCWSFTAAAIWKKTHNVGLYWYRCFRCFCKYFSREMFKVSLSPSPSLFLSLCLIARRIYTGNGQL